MALKSESHAGYPVRLGTLLPQLKQVGMTYITQRYLWWIVGLFSIVVLPNLFLAAVTRRSSSDSAAQSMLFVLGMPMLFILPFLVGQLKMQFAHSRARLTPQFLPAHLAVLCGILLLIFVLYPFGLARLAGSDPLGLVALGFAIGSPVLWGAQLNRFGPMLIGMVAFYSLLTSWGLRWWVTDAASHREANALVVLAGAGLLTAWLWRLGHLTEEMDDYENFYQAMLARRTGSDAIEQRRVVANQVRRNRFAAWIVDWWHERLGGYYGGNKFRLFRLLRYGFGANPVEVQGLFMLAMFVALGVFMSKFSYVGNAGGNFGALWFFIVFAILLPGQMAGEILAQRRPRIAYEMLLPLSRRQLIDGLFAASARNSFVLWLIMNAGLAVVVAMTNQQILPGTIAMFVLTSGSTMFTAMALGLRLSVWPSMAKRMVVAWLGWMVLIAPAFGLWASREEIGDAPLLVLAGVMLAIGALLINNARKVWLNLELG